MLRPTLSRLLASAGSLFILLAGLIGSAAISTSTVFAAPVSPTSHPITVDPVFQPAGSPTDAAFGCQTDRGPSAIVCYSPQQIQHAYHTDTLINHGITGKGSTVVIIDAFQNPTMQTDLPRSIAPLACQLRPSLKLRPMD